MISMSMLPHRSAALLLPCPVQMHSSGARIHVNSGFMLFWPQSVTSLCSTYTACIQTLTIVTQMNTLSWTMEASCHTLLDYGVTLMHRTWHDRTQDCFRKHHAWRSKNLYRALLASQYQLSSPGDCQHTLQQGGQAVP